MFSRKSLLISYFGHASFKLKTPSKAVIYIDPFANGDYSDRADLVLITHEHFDHNKIENVKLAKGACIIRAADSIKRDGAKKLSYISTEACGVKIQPVPACNKNHPIDKCVGFVLDIDGIKIYFAGDTSKTDAMASELAAMEIDYAFLPADGKYNMGIKECGECARAIKAKHVAAIHTVPCGNPDDLAFDEKKAASLDAPGAFVFKPGETLEI